MDYYDNGIKEVIQLYPKIGELLSAYGVDCATCSVGTCAMGDVLDIHDFSADLKRTITEQMDGVIKGRDVDIAAIRYVKEEKEAVYSEPIQMLVDEHKNILRLLDLAEYIARKKELTAETIDLVNEVVFYVRNYADGRHHAKEENILFVKTDGSQEVIKAMVAEHVTARALISQAAAGAGAGNQAQIRQALSDYIELLREHIRKEDKILYPWFDRNMTTEEKSDMMREFEAADLLSAADLEKNLLKLLDDNYA